MNRKERLELIKLMVESLELPEYGEKSYKSHLSGEIRTYTARISEVTEHELIRKCTQIRKELMYLLKDDKVEAE